MSEVETGDRGFATEGVLSLEDHIVLARATHALRAALTVCSESVGLDIETDSYGLTVRACMAALEELRTAELTERIDVFIEHRMEQEQLTLRALGPAMMDH